MDADGFGDGVAERPGHRQAGHVLVREPDPGWPDRLAQQPTAGLHPTPIPQDPENKIGFRAFPNKKSARNGVFLAETGPKMAFFRGFSNKMTENGDFFADF